MDSDGSVIATANQCDPERNWDVDVATSRVSPEGQALWMNAFGTSAQEAPVALALDPDGNAIVAGVSGPDIGYSDKPSEIMTVKYGGDGNEVWSARYGDPSETNYARALYVDSGGNVFVAGERLPPYGYATEIHVVKYGPNGGLVWSAVYNAYDSQSVAAITGDSLGNLFFTGYIVIEVRDDDDHDPSDDDYRDDDFDPSGDDNSDPGGSGGSGAPACGMGPSDASLPLIAIMCLAGLIGLMLDRKKT